MTSTHSAAGGDFDERLTQALESALLEGEQIVAQEAGDQGQAIVLTDSRIILLREGLAATGELNGHKASVFVLSEVSEVNLRKGPLGAVIQIVGESSQTTEGGRPDNVIVFTGPGRVKKAEAFVSTIETASGKPVNRTEPPARSQPTEQSEQPVIAEIAPDQPRTERKRRSLAEEIYSEVVEASVPPVESLSSQAEQYTSAPVMAVQAEPPIVREPEPEPESEPEAEPSAPLSAFNPNPNLPRPAQRLRHGPSPVLVSLGALAGLVFVGMAVMAPLRESPSTPIVHLVANSGSSDARVIKLQETAVSNYLSKLKRSIAKSDSETAAFRTAVRSGDRSSIESISRLNATDKAWQELSALSAPPGLVEANQNVIDGVAARKNAIAAAAAASGSGNLNAGETLSRLDAADAKIASGVSKVRSSLDEIRLQLGETGEQKTEH